MTTYTQHRLTTPHARTYLVSLHIQQMPGGTLVIDTQSTQVSQTIHAIHKEKAAA